MWFVKSTWNYSSLEGSGTVPVISATLTIFNIVCWISMRHYTVWYRTLCCTEIATQSHRRVIETQEFTPCCVVFLSSAQASQNTFGGRKCFEYVMDRERLWFCLAVHIGVCLPSSRHFGQYVCALYYPVWEKVGVESVMERHREPFLSAHSVHTWPLTEQTERCMYQDSAWLKCPVSVKHERTLSHETLKLNSLYLMWSS